MCEIKFCIDLSKEIILDYYEKIDRNKYLYQKNKKEVIKNS